MQQEKNGKKNLREEMLRQRNSLESEWISMAEEKIVEKLISSDVWKSARTVMIYMDYRKEVPTGKILKQLAKEEKTAVLPFTTKDFIIVPYVLHRKDPWSDLLTSPMGIREPDPTRCEKAEPEGIDLVLIPGVAFDENGNRLGFGRGCYDRFLPQLRPGVLKVGLAYDFQTQCTVPTGQYDVALDLIITERRILGNAPCL